MTEPPNKRSRPDSDKSKGYQYKATKRHFLEVGQRGFLATCNFREKDCVRECYNILTQYADELYGPEPKSEIRYEKEPLKEDADILDDLQSEIDAAKAASEPGRSRRFQAVDTGTKNCVFIKTTLKNPVELGTKVIKDIAENKVQRTRHLLRLTPIEVVCKASVDDITKAGEALLEKHFLGGDKTFSVVLNKRYNNDIRRDEVIQIIADLVIEKNAKNKVDLKNPDLSVVVEIIKGKCCMSVVESYFKYRKYNLVELAGSGINKVESSDPGDKNDDEDMSPATSDDAKRKLAGKDPLSDKKKAIENLPIGNKLKALLEGKKLDEEEPTAKKFKEEPEKKPDDTDPDETKNTPAGDKK